MKRRLKSAGILGGMLAVILPQLAITTAAVVLTPAVAEAQAGRMHRATRRRTAVVVHTHDQQQAAAQQQQAPPPPPPPPDGQQMSSATDATVTDRVMTPAVDQEVPAAVVARGPPDAVQSSAAVRRQRSG